MRTLVIGDIHGNIKALEQLISRANIQKEDKLIFLGDYVDGYIYSYEVIKKLMELNETNECVFLMGNHDHWCQEWLLQKDPLMSIKKMPEGQIMNGGKTTFISFASKIKDQKELNSFIKFFSNLRPYFNIDKKSFVHGGYAFGHDIDPLQFMLWDRNLVKIACEGKELGSTLSSKYDEIYVGHTGVEFWGNEKPVISVDKKIICMDTGGGWDGCISAMDIYTKDIFQSDKRDSLYSSEEPGR